MVIKDYDEDIVMWCDVINKKNEGKWKFKYIGRKEVYQLSKE